MRFDNKVAVITGGNSGIGQAIAKQFALEGAQVVILGRNLQTLQETQNLIGNRCLALQTDVCKISALKKAFHVIHESYKQIDFLILNAGIIGGGPTEKVNEETFDQVFSTNVKGPYFTFQQALPYLREGASIVAISSIASFLGIKEHGVYGASKAALNRLMAAFAAEFLKEKGWRFNTISPGYTQTPIFKKRQQNEPQYIELAGRVVPLQRMAKPEEIASSVLFLCSDEARYICGSNLVIDGGISSIYPLQEMQEYYAQRG